MTDATQSHAASAPGKVLLVGGYLVLDRAYTGLSFGLDARIHVHVQHRPAAQDGVSLQEIEVRSPQFVDAVWKFGYHTVPHDGGIGVTLLDSTPSPPNPFLQAPLTNTLTYITCTRGPHTHIAPSLITILADKPYYSTTPTTTPSSKFPQYALPLSRAAKTGLGSSAALTTALTAALLLHYLPRPLFDLSTPHGKSTLHNLAQASHSAAQGKIGSGFDVASAVRGSCLYRRFSPSILETLGEPGRPGFPARLCATVDGDGVAWDQAITPQAGLLRGAGLRLVMLDIHTGSSTPDMVRRVLAWRQSSAEVAGRYFDALHAMNNSLLALLRALAACPPKFRRYRALGSQMRAIRAVAREIGEEAGVEIEPAGQTELIDGVAEGVNRVVGGVVPGAGGLDAVALVVRDEGDVEGRVEEWLRVRGGVENGQVNVLRVRQDGEGVREEDARGQRYEGWV